MNGSVPILEARCISKRFGGLQAVCGCSFSVYDHEIVGLIGPNGSGKTTLFNILVGYTPLDDGHILFRGRDIAGLQPYQIARMGVARTFQITRIFQKMTLLENLMLPAREKGARKKANELLELVKLSQFANEYASDLSFGQQRLLSIIQVLMLDPELILLDEPAAGVNPTMQNTIVDLIHHLNREGRTFIIVEHNMDLIMNHCQRIIVLNMGEKIADGPPEAIRSDPAVLTAYFGG